MCGNFGNIFLAVTESLNIMVLLIDVYDAWKNKTLLNNNLSSLCATNHYANTQLARISIIRRKYAIIFACIKSQKHKKYNYKMNEFANDSTCT